jgi:hypothetical protein
LETEAWRGGKARTATVNPDRILPSSISLTNRQSFEPSLAPPLEELRSPGSKTADGSSRGGRYFRDVGRLADLVLAGGFEALTGAHRTEVLMRDEVK